MSEAPRRPDDEHDPVDRAADAPALSDVLSEQIGAMAARSGYDAMASNASTGRQMLAVMGGPRGIIEAVLPGLAFVLTFSLTQNLPLTLGISVGIAVAFTVWRLIERKPLMSALAGLAGVALSAILSLVTGRAEDNFLLGFWTNGVYAAGLLVTVLIGWPAVGVISGFLTDLGTRWRQDKRLRRWFTILTLGWVGFFALRLVVQLPLYYAGAVAALGTAKLVMGVPLYAPALVGTWWVVRALLAGRDTPRGDAG